MANLTKTNERRFRELAEKGFGDDTIFDRIGVLWVVFRLPSFQVYVKSVSNSYTTVKVVR